MKRSLFLASQSPRRKDILNRFSIPYNCIENLLTVEPLPNISESFSDWTIRCSREKVMASKADYKGLIF